MLNREQQREILAFGLLALSVFLLLTLLPISLLGARADTLFHSGNTMGVVGAAVRRVLVGWFGGSSVLIPALLVVGGLRSGSWMSVQRSIRLGILGGVLILLVPSLAHVMGGTLGQSGDLGALLGAPLLSALGRLGSVFLLGTLLVFLSIGTLGWNPLRALWNGLVQGSGLAGRSARWLTERMRSAGVWVSARFQAMMERRAARAPVFIAPEDAEGFFPGSEEGEAVDEELEEVEEELEEARDDPAAVEEETPKPRRRREAADTEIPPLEYLTAPEDKDVEGMERELDRLGEVLLEKLGTFSVEAELGGRTSGPVVTQFEVVPAPGVKVNKIANLDADLALALKAQSVRIVAPIPGKGAVGVEIPNPKAEVVLLREILEARAFGGAKADLPLALGRDLTGRPFVSDLAEMPHVLLAGATGSGKSVCINSFITSLVYRHTPETLRLLLIDPKMVELSAYLDLPHLRHPVVTDPRDAAGVLKWAVLEMGKRYQLLSQNRVRSIKEFNTRLLEGTVMKRAHPRGPEGDPDRWIYDEGIIPYIVIVVDELADLMMTVQAEVERPLIYLAQKARAIGVHLIIATQRPSVNVVTGLIKANFPCRIAFRVASKTDSRTIIDQNGADALLGNGDMLFIPPGLSEPVRIQGAFVSTEDTDRLTAWYREQAEILEEEGGEVMAAAAAETDILEVVRSQEAEDADDAPVDGGDEARDELFRDAAEVCIRNNHGSTSLLQRRLRVGYGRAARIVDQLEDASVLGPPDGSKGRQVLIGLEGLDLLLSGMDETFEE
jgi:S-DNA-T family DNA segregation ATPase FtsK/SpoIIIE